MAALGADSPRAYENTGAHPDYNEVSQTASIIVYNGSAVGESGSAGTGRALVAGDNFCGFCIEKSDNTGGAAGAKLIKVFKSGTVWLTVTNGALATYSDTIYASTDNDFTTASTGNSSIGKQVRFDVASGKTLVFFQALPSRSI